MICLSDEKHLNLFPGGTIVRDPLYCKSPYHESRIYVVSRIWTCAELILGLVEWSYAEVILTRLLENLVKILQLRVSFQILMVSCSTFIMNYKFQFRWTSNIQCFHHGSSALEHNTTQKNLNFSCKEVRQWRRV